MADQDNNNTDKMGVTTRSQKGKKNTDNNDEQSNNDNNNANRLSTNSNIETNENKSNQNDLLNKFVEIMAEKMKRIMVQQCEQDVEHTELRFQRNEPTPSTSRIEIEQTARRESIQDSAKEKGPRIKQTTSHEDIHDDTEQAGPKMYKRTYKPTFNERGHFTLSPDDIIYKEKETSEHSAAARGVRIPRNEWIGTPFKNLTFKGTRDSQNVVVFIRAFRKKALYENINEEEQLHWFEEILQYDAKTWIKLKEPQTIDEAIQALKEKYWSPEIQTEFRKKLFNNKYIARIGQTMSEYPIKIIEKARMLDEPITDRMIIHLIKSHFPQDIKREIKSTMSNLPEFIQLLDNLEAEKEPQKKTYTNNNNKFETDTEKGANKKQYDNNRPKSPDNKYN